jgi:hypothetical protein
MIVAISLVVVYIAMLAFLVTLRGDKEWDRLVYLLTGFEALVFTGAGALFGTTVQRANVTAAREDAANARESAKTERDRAERAEKEAVGGRALATAIHAKAKMRAPGGSRIRGSRVTEDGEEGAVAGTDSDLIELSELARAMVPDI